MCCGPVWLEGPHAPPGLVQPPPGVRRRSSRTVPGDQHVVLRFSSAHPCPCSPMASLAAAASVAPSSAHTAQRVALRRAGAARATARRPLAVRAVAAPDASTKQGPVLVNGQVLHSTTKEQLDVINSMGQYAEEQVGSREGISRCAQRVCGAAMASFQPMRQLRRFPEWPADGRAGLAVSGAADAGADDVHDCLSLPNRRPGHQHAAAAPSCLPCQVLPILKPTEKCWQPQDFLPNPEAPEFLDVVRALPGGLHGTRMCLCGCCCCCRCAVWRQAWRAGWLARPTGRSTCGGLTASLHQLPHPPSFPCARSAAGARAAGAHQGGAGRVLCLPGACRTCAAAACSAT